MTSFTDLVHALADLHGKGNVTIKPGQTELQLVSGSQEFTLCELPQEQEVLLHALCLRGISETPDLPPIRKVESTWPRLDYQKRGWHWTSIHHPKSSATFLMVRTPIKGLTPERLVDMIDDFIDELKVELEELY